MRKEGHCAMRRAWRAMRGIYDFDVFLVKTFFCLHRGAFIYLPTYLDLSMSDGRTI